ncbi:RloB domain-containing protein [Sulfurovum sp. bin170]|uniref:RloB family protein n=1 Tax=Sulfurovum sp. bin170 TaxID=2695268 RepID=UPI0013E0C0DC|nr:RloB family protein [Sulfurovum sp. bin170]NEW61317.1 RloB domain-containing protein [Sulfurovum sp. bin170]
MGRRKAKNRIDNTETELRPIDFKRDTNNRRTIPDIIISCEDEASSPTYLRQIVSLLIKTKIITQDSFVIAQHKHTNPFGVLTDLKKYEDENKKKYSNFEHKWIVIDRDVEIIKKKAKTEKKQGYKKNGHTKEDFEKAFNNAKSKIKKYHIEVAYINDSFELWYLLHFNYRDTAIIRDEIPKVVIENLKKRNFNKFKNLTEKTMKSEENTKKIYNELESLQKNAIRNAETLLASYGNTHNPEKDNPSTNFHVLVKLLNSLGKDDVLLEIVNKLREIDMMKFSELTINNIMEFHNQQKIKDKFRLKEINFDKTIDLIKVLHLLK